MKAGNILLTGVLVVLAGFVWMLQDMNGSSSSGGAVASGELGIALSSSKPVLVEFYADWCGACNAVAPSVKKLAGDLQGRAEVVRLNVDQNPDLVRQFGIGPIPCFIAFKHGKETAREVGGIPPEMMRSMIGM